MHLITIEQNFPQILESLITRESNRLRSPQSERKYHETNYCVTLRQLRLDALLNVSDTVGLYLSLKISCQKRSLLLRQ